MSIKLLRTLGENKGGDLADTVKVQLLNLEGSDEWPSGQFFRREWPRRQFYGYLLRERVLMILRAIEHSYQTKSYKTEPLMTSGWPQLQIEHVMPQSWQEHWPLPDGLTPEDRKGLPSRHREFDFGQPSVEPITVKLGMGGERPDGQETRRSE